MKPTAAPGSSPYFSTFLLEMAKMGPGNISGSLNYFFLKRGWYGGWEGLFSKQSAVAFQMQLGL